MTTVGQKMIRTGMRQLRELLFPRRYKRRFVRWPDPPTSIERRITREMTRQGLHFVVHQRFGYYTADIYLPDHRVVVECDGDYWHNLPGRREHDAKRDAWFARRGIRTFRLAEHEINRSAARCVERIRKALA